MFLPSQLASMQNPHLAPQIAAKDPPYVIKNQSKSSHYRNAATHEQKPNHAAIQFIRSRESAVVHEDTH
jgi:hypothetical protein